MKTGSPAFISCEFNQLKVRTVVDIFTCMTGILCAIALSGHIPFVYPLLLLAAMGLSVYLDLKQIHIPRWLLTVLSFAVLLYFFVRFDMEDLIGQIVEILFVFMGIKFLENKGFRDYMQIYALALFMLAGLGLMTLGMAFIVYLLTFLVLLCLSLIFLTYYAQDPELELTRQTLRTMITRSLFIPVLAIPLSGLMFIILPRTSYPVLTFLNRPDKARSGFTDNVTLGHVSDIQEDERIIFRATMEQIDESSLYWRGITLDQFDGTSWKGTKKRYYTAARGSIPAGKYISQTIYLEPYENSSLFVLDKPVHIEGRNVRRYDDLTFAMPYNVDNRIRYAVFSVLSDTVAEENIEREKYLQLPRKLPSRIVSLAKNLAVKNNDIAAVRNVFDHLNSGRYKYSLKDLPLTKNPLETFFFDSRSGNCEYFASAMAVLLRVNGIPSRIVGGYRGGYYNEIGNYYLVPQKNAHVWVETFIDGRGWVRFDPTPASPEAFAAAHKKGVFLKAQLLFDSINYYWHGIILTYNLDRQLSITRSIFLELKKPSFSFSFPGSRFARYTGIVIIAAVLMIAVWFLARSGGSREMIVLNRFLKKLKVLGYPKGQAEGLEEFAARIADERVQRISLEFIRNFENIYYTDRPFMTGDLQRLENIIKRIDDAR
jgi:transglutaminase-like putative cysteine protease